MPKNFEDEDYENQLFKKADKRKKKITRKSSNNDQQASFPLMIRRVSNDSTEAQTEVDIERELEQHDLHQDNHDEGDWITKRKSGRRGNRMHLLAGDTPVNKTFPESSNTKHRKVSIDSTFYTRVAEGSAKKILGHIFDGEIAFGGQIRSPR